ncbi:15455_t:CDS:2 [Entrophospora sp. SA101]|nr:2583_t:CDS:2 [Entrophospora sp. SA101]CAJ0633008.1 16118_t:CDS:2 [Entrophospora sp. SA101]CAJ0746616.1 17889_t:CDS:2 [Entrophospora sp. SA101]CAJ0760348.1 15455_t:CDS:2 [Entrophospora sp. SA101]CAJ0833066.1 4377_t:CDS:2 [Entrophospora sp. SA101]
MEENFLFQHQSSAPTPPRRQRSLPPSLPSYATSSLLFHRTLHPRISHKHNDVNKGKFKMALDLELREEKLREAASRGDCDSVIKLLSTLPQPDLNKSDDKGRTPLHFACAGGYYNCVQLLIEHGANVNVEADVAGNRPIHLAVISNKMECVIALLEAGAKIKINDSFDRTPISLARSRLSVLMNDFSSRNSGNSSTQSSHMNVEELAENNQQTPENRELFSQALQIIKILKHHLIIENQTMTTPGSSSSLIEKFSSPALLNKTDQIFTFDAMDALDSLTAQLSKLDILSDDSPTNITNSGVVEKSDLQKTLPEKEVLTRIQDVIDGIIKHKG